MRIVSLLASGTEIVCALGAGGSLVGRSHECDNPPWVRSLPPCSEPAFDISVSSRAIDTEVNRRIRSGEPLYRLNTELIASLAPDLIIAQEHCEVCAVTPADVERSGCSVPPARMLALTASSIDGIFESIMQVARALGREEQGRSLVCREQERLANVRKMTAGQARPSVVMLEWTDPIFAMGNWAPELVEIANGQPLLGNKGRHSFAIAFDQVIQADPDFLIVAPCGFNFERAWQERRVLQAYPGWNELRAVQEHRVAFADGNLFFNRSGMTISQTAEIIAEILHGVIRQGVTFASPAEGLHWKWMSRCEESTNRLR
jgi:iron complex transport system substrate-binding protein